MGIHPMLWGALWPLGPGCVECIGPAPTTSLKNGASQPKTTLLRSGEARQNQKRAKVRDVAKIHTDEKAELSSKILARAREQTRDEWRDFFLLNFLHSEHEWKRHKAFSQRRNSHAPKPRASRRRNNLLVVCHGTVSSSRPRRFIEWFWQETTVRWKFKCCAILFFSPHPPLSLPLFLSLP